VSRYAQDTSVPIERSRVEIEKLLDRYGADQTMQGRDGLTSFLAFRINGRQVRMKLEMLQPDDREFTHTPTGQRRTAIQAKAAWDQSCKARWRSLALVIKAKLEAIECGISTIEDEFLSFIMLPDGSSVGDYMVPQIQETYETGRMPAGLPGFNQLQLAAASQ